MPKLPPRSTNTRPSLLKGASLSTHRHFHRRRSQVASNHIDRGSPLRRGARKRSCLADAPRIGDWAAAEHAPNHPYIRWPTSRGRLRSRKRLQTSRTTWSHNSSASLDSRVVETSSSVQVCWPLRCTASVTFSRARWVTADMLFCRVDFAAAPRHRSRVWSSRKYIPG